MTDKPKPEAKKRARPIPAMGLGLFVDRRADESGKRAAIAARTFLEKLKIQSNASDWLEAEMIEVSRLYWAAYDHDNQTSYAEIKEELRNVCSSLIKTKAAFELLSKPARRALNADAVNYKRERRMTDYVAEACAAIALIEKSATNIATETYVKLPATRFEPTLLRLKEVWKLLTGSDFKITKERAPTQKEKPREFTNNSNQFAYLLMQAIDKDITAKNLSSALQKPQLDR